MKKVVILFLSAVIFLMSSFKVTADDPKTAAGAKNIFATYRTNYPKSPLGKKPGNFGYLHGTITGSVEGKNINVTASSSDIVGSAGCETEDDIVNGKPYFTFLIVSRGNEKRTAESTDAWKRCTDSEYKLLKNLIKKTGGLKGKVYSGVTGSLVVASEYKYCLSCRSVIDQFKVMFPSITITEIEGVRTTAADTPAEEYFF